ncbi:GL12721 [Drosophila persimilis]|uniref:GL12721 n=1 Tax=Drosophila persimilis TaxID=7234 RepID=B4H7Y9_DROPE|nr:GL12721 [Drosophila persimilis]
MSAVSSVLPVDPVSLLVTELAESMNLPKQKMTNGNATAAATASAAATAGAPPAGFKAHLKKVEPKNMTTPIAKAEPTSKIIIDFKAYLRRVDEGEQHFQLQQEKPPAPGTGIQQQGVDNNVDGTLSRIEDDNKKFSHSQAMQKTPSLNGGSSTSTTSQLSPKYGLKAIPMANRPGNRPPPAAPPPPPPTNSTTTTTATATATATGIRVQPQPLASSSSIKTSHSTQLFTDDASEESSGQQQPEGLGHPAPENMTQSLYVQNVQNELQGSKQSQSQPQQKPAISRESILELVGLLDGSLKHPVNAISASQWLQLSDKLNILQNSCVIFAENESMPPHSKFHFRELVTRVETQSQHLRSAGSKNMQDNERLLLEVGQSLKQISNALNR